MKIRDLIKDAECNIYYVDDKVSPTRKILKKILVIKEIRSYIEANEDVVIDLMRDSFNDISHSFNVYMDNDGKVIFSITLNRNMSDSINKNKSKNAIIFDISRDLLSMEIYVNIPDYVYWGFLLNFVNRRIFTFTQKFLNLELGY